MYVYSRFGGAVDHEKIAAGIKKYFSLRSKPSAEEVHTTLYLWCDIEYISRCKSF